MCRSPATESRAGQFSVGTLGAVSSIIRGLGDMPGRKSVVLISEALRMFGAQGRNVQLVRALKALTDEANAYSVAGLIHIFGCRYDFMNIGRGAATQRRRAP